jgi:hypothetical protein
VAINFIKFKCNFLNRYREGLEEQLKYFLPKNLYRVLGSLKYGWLPGSEILKKLIPDPDPGVKKAPDPGTKSATLQLSTKVQGSILKLDREKSRDDLLQL